MKTTTTIVKRSGFAFLLTAILFVAGLSSCTGYYYPSHGYHEQRYYHMPPGQAKKYYGTKSARSFAPGQQKKHYRY
ncbi:hypothetical protein [Niabella aurantiaca]|uniref:hypothetical protein n=1 Tax=Niabella aurantiaca TaxID=379900 RepID=UPI00036192EE|nr:hypothetical protein [Niabella aurantiaca]